MQCSQTEVSSLFMTICQCSLFVFWWEKRDSSQCWQKKIAKEVQTTSTANSKFVVQFVDCTDIHSTWKFTHIQFVHMFNVQIVLIYICASVHCRDLCWACKANCKDFGRSWSVQAALLQSQTGFDHHHSNSATALTFIKYLLMFRQVIIHDLDERAAGLFTIQINVHPPTSVLRNQFHEHVQAVKEHVR